MSVAHDVIENPEWLNYTCHLCGKEGTAEYDPNCGVQDREKWRKLLVCNRCADFERGRLNLESRILGANVVFQSARILRADEDDELQNLETVMRNRLIELTKSYDAHLARRYAMPPRWEPEFVSELMRPLEPQESVENRVKGILAVYRRQFTR